VRVPERRLWVHHNIHFDDDPWARMVCSTGVDLEDSGVVGDGYVGDLLTEFRVRSNTNE
jgi:hypothetical protein